MDEQHENEVDRNKEAKEETHKVVLPVPVVPVTTWWVLNEKGARGRRREGKRERSMKK